MSTFLAVKKYGRRILLGLIIVTGATTFFWYRNVQKRPDPGTAPPVAPLVPSTAQMVTRDFRHVETRMNETVWILESAVAEIFEQKARLQRVKITYYGKEKEPVVITGKRARVDLGTWDAVLFDAVRVVGRDGLVLKTRRLEWDNKRQELTAPWPVRFRSRLFDVRGGRMTANLSENWVRIEGRVKTVIRPPAGFFEPTS